MSRPIENISQQLSPRAKAVIKIAVHSAYCQYIKLIIETLSHTTHNIFQKWSTVKSNTHYLAENCQHSV